MIKQNHGVILNMSSVVGMNGKERMTDYAAAKSGIIGFTKSLALELGKYNIRVNCISPGMVNQKPFDMGIEYFHTYMHIGTYVPESLHVLLWKM